MLIIKYIIKKTVFERIQNRFPQYIDFL